MTTKLKYEDNREITNTLGKGGSKVTKQKHRKNTLGFGLLTSMQTPPLTSLLLTGQGFPCSNSPLTTWKVLGLITNWAIRNEWQGV